MVVEAVTRWKRERAAASDMRRDEGTLEALDEGWKGVRWRLSGRVADGLG